MFSEQFYFWRYLEGVLFIMNVGQLIKVLETMPPEMEVIAGWNFWPAELVSIEEIKDNVTDEKKKVVWIRS